MTQATRTLVWCMSLAAALPSTAEAGCLSPVGASGSNPNSRYVISLSNQEVYDTVTDITWQRCPHGWFVNPDGKSCLQLQGNTGAWSQRPNAGENLVQVMQHRYGPSDWYSRGWLIPSRKNLSTLIDHVCKNPAINQEVFPNTPAGNFWTSDSKGTNSHGHDFYYVVDFAGDGGTTDHEDYNAWPIRLMHKGKTPAIQATLEKRPVASQ